MDSASAAYTFPSERAARDAVFSLLRELRSAAPRRVTRSMSYLDTADWSLYRGGARLAVAWEGSRAFLLWRAGARSGFSRRPVDRPPESRDDVPYDDLREQIGALAGARRLETVVDLALEGRVWGVLDERDKTVVELMLERAVARGVRPDDPRKRLGPTVRVIPVLGYRAPYEALRDAVARIPGATVETEGLLEQALRALGRRPPQAGPDRSWTLRPEMRTDDALKVIFRVLLEALLHNERGAREGLDAEFLHDFRVAVRRTRSGLGQLRDVFPRTEERRFKQGFSWLGGVTGPLRDLDVHLETLPRQREWVDAELRPELDVVERWLERRRAEEQRKLVAALDSPRYRKLVSAWSLFLGRPSPRATRLAHARRPILEIAAERIGRAHARSIRRGSVLRPASPAGDFHRLRIECKKLRYLLEFFAGLFPEAGVDGPVGALKKLQNSLGEHHDLTVERDLLRELERELERPEDARAREAVGGLERGIDARQAEVEAQCLARFAAFHGPEFEETFRRLAGEPAPCA